jgi:cyclin E
LHRETFHLGIDLVDRLFSKDKFDVSAENLQLIGTTALLLAAKIEEIYPPKLVELVSLTAGACNEDHVRRMEEIILTKLEWHCSPVTAVQWLSFYLQLIAKAEDKIICYSNFPIAMLFSRTDEMSKFIRRIRLSVE